MIDFMTGCFDLLFNLLPNVSNPIIALPFFAIIISILFSVVFKFIRGDYK